MKITQLSFIFPLVKPNNTVRTILNGKTKGHVCQGIVKNRVIERKTCCMRMAEWQRNSHSSTLAVNVDLDRYFDIKDEESKL